MRTTQYKIISLALSLFAVTGAHAEDSAALIHRVNSALQEQIELRMQHSLGTRPGFEHGVESVRLDPALDEPRQVVEGTDCPCEIPPLAG